MRNKAIYEVQIDYKPLEGKAVTMSSFFEDKIEAGKARMNSMKSILLSYAREFPHVKFELDSFEAGRTSGVLGFCKEDSGYYTGYEDDIYAIIPNGTVYLFKIRKV